MKQLIYILVILVFGACSSTNQNENASDTPAQKIAPEDIYGAWYTSFTDADGKKTEAVTIVTDGYIAETFHNVADQRFDYTIGGKWTLDSNNFVLTREFHSADSAAVGKTSSSAFAMIGKDTIKFESEDYYWTRIDDGTPGDLNGAWLITGRERDGELSRWTPGERKTMKILSGTRFQWIAYHTGNGGFFGTGGGTYTTIDSTYTENIEFFSRDSSRVGASLEFTYALDSGEWHHSGFSSKGGPLYEIWTPRSMLE